MQHCYQFRNASKEFLSVADSFVSYWEFVEPGVLQGEYRVRKGTGGQVYVTLNKEAGTRSGFIFYRGLWSCYRSFWLLPVRGMKCSCPVCATGYVSWGYLGAVKYRVILVRREFEVLVSVEAVCTRLQNNSNVSFQQSHAGIFACLCRWVSYGSLTVPKELVWCGWGFLPTKCSSHTQSENTLWVSCV